uniref:Solute carrier family 2 member 11 n=1 Tax=Sinocyclocheilus grahami TaxID=75366 RepID=A0A672PBM2_SINGR
MQLCGNDSIYFYASYVFQEAGISAEQIQYVTIGTGMCEFTACILCLIERLGRRLMLMGGFVLMAGWAVVFTVALSLENMVTWMPYLSMTCIFTYILSFGMGPAGVTGILPTEIFNQTTHPAAYMAAGSLMWLNLLIIGMIFPFLLRVNHTLLKRLVLTRPHISTSLCGKICITPPKCSRKERRRNFYSRCSIVAAAMS